MSENLLLSKTSYITPSGSNSLENNPYKRKISSIDSPKPDITLQERINRLKGIVGWNKDNELKGSPLQTVEIDHNAKKPRASDQCQNLDYKITTENNNVPIVSAIAQELITPLRDDLREISISETRTCNLKGHIEDELEKVLDSSIDISEDTEYFPNYILVNMKQEENHFNADSCKSMQVDKCSEVEYNFANLQLVLYQKPKEKETTLSSPTVNNIEYIDHAESNMLNLEEKGLMNDILDELSSVSEIDLINQEIKDMMEDLVSQIEKDGNAFIMLASITEEATRLPVEQIRMVTKNIEESGRPVEGYVAGEKKSDHMDGTIEDNEQQQDQFIKEVTADESRNDLSLVVIEAENTTEEDNIDKQEYESVVKEGELEEIEKNVVSEDKERESNIGHALDSKIELLSELILKETEIGHCDTGIHNNLQNINVEDKTEEMQVDGYNNNNDHREQEEKKQSVVLMEKPEHLSEIIAPQNEIDAMEVEEVVIREDKKSGNIEESARPVEGYVAGEKKSDHMDGTIEDNEQQQDQLIKEVTADETRNNLSLVVIEAENTTEEDDIDKQVYKSVVKEGELGEVEKVVVSEDKESESNIGDAPLDNKIEILSESILKETEIDHCDTGIHNNLQNINVEDKTEEMQVDGYNNNNDHREQEEKKQSVVLMDDVLVEEPEHLSEINIPENEIDAMEVEEVVIREDKESESKIFNNNDEHAPETITEQLSEPINQETDIIAIDCNTGIPNDNLQAVDIDIDIHEKTNQMQVDCDNYDHREEDDDNYLQQQEEKQRPAIVTDYLFSPLSDKEKNEFEKVYSTRKMELEIQAENRAKLLSKQWQRDKLSLQRIIDDSLKGYLDIYEKAHALRLQFEHEKQVWKSAVLQNGGNEAFGCNNDYYDYPNQKQNVALQYKDSMSKLDLTKEFKYDVEEDDNDENNNKDKESSDQPWGYNLSSSSSHQKRALEDIPKYGLSKDKNVFGVIKIQKPFQVPGAKEVKLNKKN